MPTPGRNDPCYCGSGKKYKHCHEAADRAVQAEAHAWDMARQSLTGDVIAFAREKRFAESFAEGLKLFWNGHYTIETAGGMDEDETLRFFDWFVFDYTPADRPRLLDVYAAEKAASLQEFERKQLEAWLAAKPSSAYRVEAVGANQLTLRDLFDDSTVVVKSEAGAQAALVGEVLLARMVQVHRDVRFSGSTPRLPGRLADEVKAMLLQAFEDYRADKPEAAWCEFLRMRSYLLTHLALKHAEAEGRAPVAGKDTAQGTARGTAQGTAGRAARHMRPAARR